MYITKCTAAALDKRPCDKLTKLYKFIYIYMLTYKSSRPIDNVVRLLVTRKPSGGTTSHMGGVKEA